AGGRRARLVAPQPGRHGADRRTADDGAADREPPRPRADALLRDARAARCDLARPGGRGAGGLRLVSPMLNLAAATDAGWVERALAGLDEVLVDHAHCEKKAASSAVSVLFKYPERHELGTALARFA